MENKTMWRFAWLVKKDYKRNILAKIGVLPLLTISPFPQRCYIAQLEDMHYAKFYTLLWKILTSRQDAKLS